MTNSDGAAVTTGRTIVHQRTDKRQTKINEEIDMEADKTDLEAQLRASLNRSPRTRTAR